MESKFRFDPKTGTMVPIGGEATVEASASITETTNTDSKPEFAHNKTIETSAQPQSGFAQLIHMQRVNTPTPVQLVNDKGLPEAYLDSLDKGVMMFRELEDYDICRIEDERTRKVLAYIGGYALQINFNMAELNTMEKIEQCLDGITKLFRHKLMSQHLGPSQPK